MLKRWNRISSTAVVHLLALIAPLLATPLFAVAQAPARYHEFTPVAPRESLAKAIASSENLLLLPGTHQIDNPIVVAIDHPLRVHGADRVQTRIVPRHRDRPLFVVERAPLVNLTNLSLSGPPSNPPVGFVAIETRNSTPLGLELQDVSVVDAGLMFSGGGSIRLQGTSLMPHGHVPSTIVIDHPEARFLMVGGNISNESSPARGRPGESFHVWLKRGHLRIVGTGVQATHGIADFRIDGAAREPHLIANVRSEGANGARRGELPSRLLHVPKSAAAVDVLLVSNGASWNEQGFGVGALVDYSAAGTVWLVGNNGSIGAGSLVTGSAPDATWIAVGNLSFDGDRLFTGSSGRAFAQLNLYSHRYKSGLPLPPLVRFAPDRSPRGEKLPAIPSIDIPGPLTRPGLDRPIPGMLNVAEFGAVGDGVSDDTDEIQAALDSACDGKQAKRLFFPAGTYRVSRTLRLNHREAGCQRHPSGGWIAGAGRDRTTLIRAGGGGVFATQGLAYATVQGITFKTERGGREPTFALENVTNVGHATQGVSFYDVRFDGGREALGIGLDSEHQCSENLLVDAEFKNAEYGLGVGSYNALANLVYRGSFVDNGITMGHPEDALSGGTWAVLGARVRGTRERDLSMRNSANGVWLFYGMDSTSPVLVTTGATGAAFPMVFDSSQLEPPADSTRPYVDFAAAGGPIFLHSQLTRGQIRNHGGIVENYVIAIESRAPGWGVSESTGSARKAVLGAGYLE